MKQSPSAVFIDECVGEFRIDVLILLVSEYPDMRRAVAAPVVPGHLDTPFDLGLPLGVVSLQQMIGGGLFHRCEGGFLHGLHLV